MWRPAHPNDDDAVAEMCLELNRLDPGPSPVPKDAVLRTLRTLRAEPVRGRTVVLDVGAGAAGYAFLISFWSNELGGEVRAIDEIYIDRQLRSRGHATSLVKALVAGTELWPGSPVALELEVSTANRRARALYERLGFTPIRNAMLRRELVEE